MRVTPEPDLSMIGDPDMTTADPPDMAQPIVLGPANFNFDSPVTASVHAGSAWYVGGYFSVAGATNAPRAFVLTTAGNPTGCSYAMGFGNTVFATLRIGNAIYIGGAFSEYNGQPAHNIAKIDATTCALDTTFNPPANDGFDSYVYALATDGTSLYAGGEFQHYRGVLYSANRLAKLDLTSGALDTTFSPVGQGQNGVEGPVLALATDGSGNLYVGGSFSQYRGAAASAYNFAKLNASTGALDTTFGPSGPTMNGFNAQVRAIAVQGNNIYVGGEFSAYRNAANSARRFAKLSNTGVLDTTFSPAGVNMNGFDSDVFGIAATATTVYVVGQFQSYKGVGDSAYRIAKLDASTGAIDTAFSPVGATFNGFNATAYSIVLDGNTLYVGGAFNSYRSGIASNANKIAKLNATTGVQDTTFIGTGSNVNGFSGGSVRFISLSGGNLYTSGDFSLYGGRSANFIAKIDDATGAVDTTFSPPSANGFDSNVVALAASGNSLYVAGYFTAYRGVANSAFRIAKLDLTTGAIDTTFSPPGVGMNGFNQPTYALAVSSTSVYVGGGFNDYRGVANSANNLAKLDATSGVLDTTFSPVGATANGFNDDVYALSLSGNTLFVGGDFARYRGVADSAFYVAKLDATSGALDTTFSPAGANLNGFDSSVYTLSTNGTSLWAGGSFSEYRGVANSAFYIAKLDATSGVLDTTFSPPGVDMNGLNDDVYTSLVIGNALYLGGTFTDYRGVANSANYYAKLDATSGALDTTFTPSGNTIYTPINTFSTYADYLFVGGEFFGCKSGTCGRNGFRLDPLTANPK